MTIVLTGGGSGGHITPILAIAHELRRIQPEVRIVYIGLKGDRLGDLPKQDPNIDAVYAVRAGKFRRYHGEGLKQLLDIKTWIKNFRDLMFVIVGFFQSWFLLRKIRPDRIFIKGGFVGVPVGLAAALRKIPYVTHDSDVMPGLANRIIARWASIHSVALPKEVYKYPEHKTVTVGVPIHANYRPITPALQQEYRNNIGLGEYHKMILITGGGLGARRLNKAVAKILPELLHQYEDLVVVHTVGRGNEKTMNSLYQETLTPDEFKRTFVEGYLTDLYKYSGAADLIIARAGATNLAEFAAQGKACIIVPNPQLTGGHQLKNAAYLAAHQAIEIITENDISRNDNLFEQKIHSLLDSQDQRDLLKTNLTTFAQPNASTQIAELLLEPTLKIAHN